MVADIRAAAPAFQGWSPVLAHIGVVATDPPVNAVIEQPAGPIRVTFDGPLAEASSLQLLDSGFHRVDDGPSRIENERTLAVGVQPDAVGWFTVQYDAIGSADGHAASGSYAVEIVPASVFGGAMPLAIASAALIGAAIALLARRKRQAVSVFACAALMVGAAGCKSAAPPVATDDGDAAQAASGSGTVAPVEASAMSVVLASSDLSVGPDRFAFALLDENGALIENANVGVTFFRLEGEAAMPASSTKATYYTGVVPGSGLYVTRAEFDVGGAWGSEMRATLPSGEELPPQRVRFQVGAGPRSPAIGAAPPPTINPTVGVVVPGGTVYVGSVTPAELAAISSDPDPDPTLYSMTVDEAAASGRPTVVIFSTPAHCQSKICGPVLDEVKKVKREWTGTVNFIHIDVYSSFDPLVMSPLMDAWGLNTEPWVFVLDSAGKIADRLEGNVTAAELGPIVASVAGSPS